MHLFVVDDEEAETLIKELFSNGRIPDNNEPNYKDLGVTSDDDMSRIAFHEMGQVLLKKNEDGSGVELPLLVLVGLHHLFVLKCQEDG